MIASFLLAHWRALGALILVAALAAYIETIRVELDLCHTKLAAAQQENTALRDRIKLQNDALDKLKAEGDRKTAAGAQALQDAITATQKAVGEAARLKALASKSRSPEQPRPANCPASGADRAVTTIRQGL